MNNTKIYDTYEDAKKNAKRWTQDGNLYVQYPPYHDYVNGKDFGDLNPQPENLGSMLTA